MTVIYLSPSLLSGEDPFLSSQHPGADPVPCSSSDTQFTTLSSLRILHMDRVRQNRRPLRTLLTHIINRQMIRLRILDKRIKT